MTVIRGTELGQALAKSLTQLDAQIDAVTAVSKELGCTPYEVRDGHGAFMMAPLIVSKVQCLHALVLVNQRRK